MGENQKDIIYIFFEIMIQPYAQVVCCTPIFSLCYVLLWICEMLIQVVHCRLQKFKLMTANTVISSENASMETMGTEQVTCL